MKRIFFVAGELSGDQLGAWYIKKTKADRDQTLCLEGVGGDALQAVGVKLFERFEKLNVVGIVEIIRHVPRLLSFMNAVIDYIVERRFDEVVLIDFPGFNLRLARKLKQRNAAIKITYLSPPQLWCWGQWRLASLKKYSDQIIVMYPFEVGWYRQRGVKVQWLGNPVYDRLRPYAAAPVAQCAQVALLPGSRTKEIETLLPVMAEVVRVLHERFPELAFVLPRPSSLSCDFLQHQLERFQMQALVRVIEGEEYKMRALQESCFAMTKPGTVTLELALLRVPALVMYKTSPLTYFLGKRFAYITQMALPNLLSAEQVYPEFIQDRCRQEFLVEAAECLYKNFCEKNTAFNNQKEKMNAVKNLFSSKYAEM